MLKFSIMTEPHLGGTYEQQLAAARLAESEGLVSFARCDHFLTGRDPVPDATDAFAVLAGLARETSGIRLCVLVSPITFRHPAVIAKNAATIDQMSDGRFDLGVGTGWMDLEHNALGIPFPDSAERWGRFEDSLDYLDAAFAEGHGRHDGSYYSLDADVKPNPTGLRLVLGGSGAKRTPTLAGQRADEYNFFTCPPDEAAAKIAVMREAANGRAVEATAMGPVIVADNDAAYRERMEAFAQQFDVDVDDLIARFDEQGRIHGTRSDVHEKIAALEEAGVERLYVQWLDLDDYDGLARTMEMVRA